MLLPYFVSMVALLMQVSHIDAGNGMQKIHVTSFISVPKIILFKPPQPAEPSRTMCSAANNLWCSKLIYLFCIRGFQNGGVDGRYGRSLWTIKTIVKSLKRRIDHGSNLQSFTSHATRFVQSDNCQSKRSFIVLTYMINLLQPHTKMFWRLTELWTNAVH
jgi:hypothetical protein